MFTLRVLKSHIILLFKETSCKTVNAQVLNISLFEWLQSTTVTTPIYDWEQTGTKRGAVRWLPHYRKPHIMRGLRRKVSSIVSNI